MTVNKMSTGEPVFPLFFRLATAADRPRLISLINAAFAIETFLEGTRTDDVRLAGMMQKGEILTAEDGSGQLIGCIYLEVLGKRGYLGQLAVDPVQQRRHIGRQILDAAEEHLRREGCDAVDIKVLSLRPELPPIYRRFGYLETGTEEFLAMRALEPGAECHCIVMSKSL
jgi:predicted N-acetyltransferase YhbS